MHRQTVTQHRQTATTPRQSVSASRQMAAILTAAFTLSVVHTVYAWIAGLESPDFNVRTPIAWVFYTVAFGMSALSLRPQRWARWTVQVFIALVLLVGIFVYPQTFEPHQQTVFGWFENDVYIGLLILAGYLGIMRLRGLDVRAR